MECLSSAVRCIQEIYQVINSCLVYKHLLDGGLDFHKISLQIYIFFVLTCSEQLQKNKDRGRGVLFSYWGGMNYNPFSVISQGDDGYMVGLQ